eukprot:CAMPEP_0114586984 /NCGR_PEP_ID=MMETSP0125-20121206/10064_1 /TAXON_ID=485358 ORGANISM="Aristerostoma sp., Strain ATCC 50986" /NCGR_SAMPLE_ID=MMETSP0125 /ASSEMBLY_ACC=CAM_ASM_000245 /LENGTH=97 /DNA_ID=CAMNT_0001782681 /DNA_START=771 /DNA_END=1064 /DNA_ORIENTATION=-
MYKSDCIDQLMEVCPGQNLISGKLVEEFEVVEVSIGGALEHNAREGLTFSLIELCLAVVDLDDLENILMLEIIGAGLREVVKGGEVGLVWVLLYQEG